MFLAAERGWSSGQSRELGRPWALMDQGLSHCWRGPQP